MENEQLTIKPSKETRHWKQELAEKQTAELYSQALDTEVITDCKIIVSMIK